MKIAIYARISTNGQKQDTENQLVPLREWASRLGGEVITEYIDHASGAKGDRKALLTLFEDAHKRKFDVLLIWALDRISREGIVKMTSYLETFKRYGVRVLSHQEPWLDTSGPVSELLTAIFGWVASQERARIKERIVAGLDRAKAKGKTLGRPEANFSVKKAIELRESGKNLREIADLLGVGKSTLSRTLLRLTKPCGTFNVL